MATLSDRLSEALAIRGMKPVELSELTGIGKSSISQYLSGRNNPNGKNILKISEALGVEEAWLMGYDDVLMERTPNEVRKAKGETLEDQMSRMMFNYIKAYYDALTFSQRVDFYEKLSAIDSKK